MIKYRLSVSELVVGVELILTGCRVDNNKSNTRVGWYESNLCQLRQDRLLQVQEEVDGRSRAH